MNEAATKETVLRKFAQLVIGMAGVVTLAITCKVFLCPLVFALLISFLLLPVASFFENRVKMNRGFASLCAVLLLVALLEGIFYVVCAQIKGFAQDWPQLKKQLSGTFDQVQDMIFKKFNVNSDKQLSYLHSAGSKLLNSSMIGETLHSFTSVFVFLAFMVFDTFFFLYYRGLLLRFLYSVFKGKNAEIVGDIVNHVQTAMQNYTN